MTRQPGLDGRHRSAARPSRRIRCSTPCSKAEDGASCRFHDQEPVGPNTPLPPYRESCFCWVEEIDPAPQAEPSAAITRTT